VFISSYSAFAGSKKGDGLKISFIVKEADKKVDVIVDGKFFTSYCWPDNVMKPILYPVMTSEGTEITRGFPLKPRAGERVDHPHHIGIWFNYGDVAGFDLWNNSEAIPTDKKSGYGSVIHMNINQLKEGVGEAIMVTTESWTDASGKELLSEKTEYHFFCQRKTRIIDRVATLTATGKEVSMKDNKEGMIAIRVARQLELPSKDEFIMTNALGNPTTVKKNEQRRSFRKL